MEPSDDDFKTLFHLFHDLIDFSEGCESEVNVELNFKKAKIIEDFYHKLRDIGGIETFNEKLKEFWTIVGRGHIPVEYFETCSDIILARYLTDDRFDTSIVKNAVDIYVTSNSQLKFQSLVKNLICTQKAVFYFEYLAKITEKSIDYEARIASHALQRLIISNCGEIDRVVDAVVEMVCESKYNFRMFLNVLCLQCNSEQFQLVEAVSLGVIQSMERRETFQELWDVLLSDSEPNFIYLVLNNKFILKFIFSTIASSAKQLKCNYTENTYSWKYIEEQNNLSFENIVNILRRIRNINCETSHKVNSFLFELRTQEGKIDLLVSDILRTIK